MMNTTKILLVFAAILVIILLEIFLSRRERFLPGLVLPGISFLISLLFCLNMMIPKDMSIAESTVELVVAFLLANVPTAILLAIFFSGRKKRSCKKQLDKMSIQDLD